jgi:hypothetical protein
MAKIKSGVDCTFGLDHQAQCNIHRCKAKIISLYIQPSQNSQGMHDSNIYLKLTLTLASWCFLQVPSFVIIGRFQRLNSNLQLGTIIPPIHIVISLPFFFSF